MREVSLKELLEAGCHFGHQVPKSNPKAREFVYTSRDKIQIIDLVKTKQGLEKAVDFVKGTIAKGGKILFLATKKQAQNIVLEEAKRCGAFFMVKRWIGGLLTNWEEIKKNLKRMEELRENLKSDQWTKREKVLMEKKLRKLEVIYGGIERLDERPQLIYIVDTHEEENAVFEANKMGIPIVGIVDTNGNPELVNYPIPANDDAVKSIQLITTSVADAVIEGQAMAEKVEKEALALEKKKGAVPKEEKEKGKTTKIKPAVKKKKVSEKEKGK